MSLQHVETSKHERVGTPSVGIPILSPPDNNILTFRWLAGILMTIMIGLLCFLAFSIWTANERIARNEEKIKGVSDDVKEIKTDVRFLRNKGN